MEIRSEVVLHLLPESLFKSRDRFHICPQYASSSTLIGYRERDLLPPAIKERCALFDTVFENVYGSNVSQDARKALKLQGSEFTYGEVEYLYFVPLLKMAAPKSGGVFWDLGCGTGKGLVAAALSENHFDKICGVEFIETLAQTARLTTKRYSEMAVAKGYETKERMQNLFNVVQGDMTKVDWSDADLIYVSSICFPDSLIHNLVELGKKLKAGTRILTLKIWEDRSTYRVLHNLRIKMSWGKNGVYILEKL